MLEAMERESEKSVRNAIAQFVGILVKHEFRKNDAWANGVLNFIFDRCRSGDAQQSEVIINFAILPAT